MYVQYQWLTLLLPLTVWAGLAAVIVLVHHYTFSSLIVVSPMSPWVMNLLHVRRRRVVILITAGMLAACSLYVSVFPPNMATACVELRERNFQVQNVGDRCTPPPLAHEVPWTGSHLLDEQPLDQLEYQQQLFHFACPATQPSQALVITGPRNSGKSFGLTHAVRRWRQQQRLVIDVDLKPVR